MPNGNKMYLVQDFFLAVECPSQEEPEIVEAIAHLELTEFSLTEEEIEKFQRILKKLELRLTDKFAQTTLAASVSAKICPSQQINP